MDFIKAKSLYWLFILFQYQNTSCDKAAKYAHFLGFRNYKTQQMTYKIMSKAHQTSREKHALEVAKPSHAVSRLQPGGCLQKNTRPTGDLSAGMGPSS